MVTPTSIDTSLEVLTTVHVGQSNVGKSRFIATVTGDQSIGIGTGGISMTSRIRSYSARIPMPSATDAATRSEVQLNMLDTVGFRSSRQGDEEVPIQDAELERRILRELEARGELVNLVVWHVKASIQEASLAEQAAFILRLLNRPADLSHILILGVVQKQQGHKVDLATDNAITALQAAERTVCDREATPTNQIRAYTTVFGPHRQTQMYGDGEYNEVDDDQDETDRATGKVITFGPRSGDNVQDQGQGGNARFGNLDLARWVAGWARSVDAIPMVLEDQQCVKCRRIGDARLWPHRCHRTATHTHRDPQRMHNGDIAAGHSHADTHDGQNTVIKLVTTGTVYVASCASGVGPAAAFLDALSMLGLTGPLLRAATCSNCGIKFDQDQATLEKKACLRWWKCCNTQIERLPTGEFPRSEQSLVTNTDECKKSTDYRCTNPDCDRPEDPSMPCVWVCGASNPTDAHEIHPKNDEDGCRQLSGIDGHELGQIPNTDHQ